jgi:hypothetical protein
MKGYALISPKYESSVFVIISNMTITEANHKNTNLC